ncbi:glycoside hydrolase [Brucella sp. MAB-22]|uniref:glycoside hydrolase n=1 Tax=Brucella TaxID=234 RepID=UPI000F667357|nr:MULTISPECIES: glycoside hydrolase [Brucella]RRY20079.1 glycoside hydrolase [Brucella anthropi]UYT54703.1 glycoside hydrolase [Brucella sp. MAB-22]
MMKTRKSTGGGIVAAVALLGGMLLLAAQSESALADTRFGVNRVNMAWLKLAERKQIFDQMVENGVVAVRLSLTRPVDQSIDAVRLAHEKGLAILLEISLNNADFYPEGTKPRSGRGRIWDMYRLSDISPEHFQQAIGDALQKIDALGVPLVAVEPGNEINWGAYNGDLAILPKEKMKTARSLSEMEELPLIEKGAEKYVELLRIVRTELAKTRHSTKAKVVSAGLSDIPFIDADRRGIDTVDPAVFTDLLKKYGLNDAADGYGIHIYPGSSGTRAARAKHISSALSFCGGADGKPCWITEWGFANTSKACPANDNNREQLVEKARDRFRQMMDSGQIAAAYYFDWDASTYGVWRCGSLTPAGKAATVTK